MGNTIKSAATGMHKHQCANHTDIQTASPEILGHIDEGAIPLISCPLKRAFNVAFVSRHAY